MEGRGRNGTCHGRDHGKEHGRSWKAHGRGRRRPVGGHGRPWKASEEGGPAEGRGRPWKASEAGHLRIRLLKVDGPVPRQARYAPGGAVLERLGLAAAPPHPCGRVRAALCQLMALGRLVLAGRARPDGQRGVEELLGLRELLLRARREDGGARRRRPFRRRRRARPQLRTRRPARGGGRARARRVRRARRTRRASRVGRPRPRHLDGLGRELGLGLVERQPHRPSALVAKLCAKFHLVAAAGNAWRRKLLPWQRGQDEATLAAVRGIRGVQEGVAVIADDRGVRAAVRIHGELAERGGRPARQHTRLGVGWQWPAALAAKTTLGLLVATTLARRFQQIVLLRRQLVPATEAVRCKVGVGVVGAVMARPLDKRLGFNREFRRLSWCRRTPSRGRRRSDLRHPMEWGVWRSSRGSGRRRSFNFLSVDGPDAHLGSLACSGAAPRRPLLSFLPSRRGPVELTPLPRAACRLTFHRGWPPSPSLWFWLTGSLGA